MPAATTAAPPPDAQPPGTAVGKGRVVAVEPPFVLRLDDGTAVRLALLHWEWPPRDARPAAGAWPPAAAALEAVRAAAQGRTVTLWWPGPPASDRHGRLIAHVMVEGRWLQETLVRAGQVRIATSVGETAGVAALLATEDAARRAKIGLWADPGFAPRRPHTAAAAIGTFHLIEGRVTAAQAVRGTLYLNFGADWRDDFTIALPERLAESLDRTAEALAGRKVRVRGWLRARNGPMIELDHAAPLELLSED